MTNWNQYANFVCKECGHKVRTSKSFLTDFFSPDFCDSCGSSRYNGWWRESWTEGMVSVGGENSVWYRPSTWATSGKIVKNYYSNQPEDDGDKND